MEPKVTYDGGRCIALGDRAIAIGRYRFAFAANGLNYSAQMNWLEWFIVRRLVLRAAQNPGRLNGK